MGIHRNPGRCGIPEGAGAVLSSEMGREGGGMLLFSQSVSTGCGFQGHQHASAPCGTCKESGHRFSAAPPILPVSPPPTPTRSESGPGHVTGFGQWDTSRCERKQRLKKHLQWNILLSLKKERDSDTHYNMDGPEDVMLSERSQTQKDKYCLIPLT